MDHVSTQSAFSLPDNHLADSGIFPARQKRSVVMRDAYVSAGIELLNTVRLRELRVPDLAAHCGYSVGGFYTRFKDKEAFFRALQMAVMATHRETADTRFDLARLAGMPFGEALDDIVNVMVEIFTGPSRGVLRESFLRISEPDDPWAPMRETRERMIGLILKGLKSRASGFSDAAAEERLIFGFQVIIGTLQNDLVNPWPRHSTRDDSLQKALQTLYREYLGEPRST